MGFREVISTSTSFSNGGDQPSFPASTLIFQDGFTWGSQSGNPSGSGQTPFGPSSMLAKIQGFEHEASCVCLVAGVISCCGKASSSKSGKDYQHSIGGDCDQSPFVISQGSSSKLGNIQGFEASSVWLGAGVSWGSKRRRTIISDPVLPMTRVWFDDKDIDDACGLLVLANQDPWEIKKKLTPSDLAGQSRLLISKKLVTDHVIQHLDMDSRTILRSKDGLSVGVRDCDTGDLFRLKLKWWKTSKSYVLVDGWRKDFVMRRALNRGDEIGLYWCLNQHMLVFSILQRAAPAA